MRKSWGKGKGLGNICIDKKGSAPLSMGRGEAVVSAEKNIATKESLLFFIIRMRQHEQCTNTLL